MKGNGQELRMGLLGSALGFLGVLTAAAFLAWLINRELMGLEYLDYGSAAALICGGLLAGFSCGRGVERWIRSGIAAPGMILILLAVNLIGYDGSLPGLLPCLVLVLGSVVSATLVMGEKKGGKRRKYQIKKYRTG